jgi:hypothetical protein
VRQRVLGRLRQSIAAGAVGPALAADAGDPGALTSGQGAAKAGSALGKLAGGWAGKTVLLAALVGGGAALHAWWPSSSGAGAGTRARTTAAGGAERLMPPAGETSGELRAGTVATPGLEGAGTGAAGQQDPDAAAGAPSEHAPATRARPTASSRANRLAAERALLDRARSALMRGDGETALGPLGKHARSFPRGQLVEEREGMRVKALVLAGRQTEARARASSFRRRFPHSLFLPVVEAALRSTRG